MKLPSPYHLLPDEPIPSCADYVSVTQSRAVALAGNASPADVLGIIQASGLRGRGGAGFPTGTKWRTVKDHPCPTRYVVCNAAEGEPGTFKDRWILRRNPYAVIEGMLVAAHVVDAANELFIAVKASFKTEIRRLRSAVNEMAASGVLGRHTIRIVEGPEEYLYGEEKALLEVVSGNDPLPREPHYPPYELGLFATATSPNPAVVNNVQTFAHVPSIMQHGADGFRRLGTHDTPGTIVYTLSGDLRRPGIYELEAGISLKELFYEIGGGPKEGRHFKAALSGVAAAPIEADRFDTPADFSSLHLAGSALGSAGFILCDDASSMPRIAQAIARFLYVESCNQCSACKHGLRSASESLDGLFEPEPSQEGGRARNLWRAKRSARKPLLSPRTGIARDPEPGSKVSARVPTPSSAANQQRAFPRSQIRRLRRAETDVRRRRAPGTKNARLDL